MPASFEQQVEGHMLTKNQLLIFSVHDSPVVVPENHIVSLHNIEQRKIMPVHEIGSSMPMHGIDAERRTRLTVWIPEYECAMRTSNFGDELAEATKLFIWDEANSLGLGCEAKFSWRSPVELTYEARDRTVRFSIEFTIASQRDFSYIEEVLTDSEYRFIGHALYYHLKHGAY